jgi:signal peptidase II
LAGLAVLVLDQPTKFWAQASLPRGREVTVIAGWLWFRLTTNTGASLGLLGGHTVFLAVVSVLLLVALVVLVQRAEPEGWFGLMAIGSLTGGVASNLLDRIRLGGVIDFIEIHGWPTDFNLADAAIRLGGLLVLISLLIAVLRGLRRRPGSGPSG